LDDPKCVPNSAIHFGGRRATNVPLVTESFDWQHGVFQGSIMSSETTAAQAGAVGKLRFDPFAMLPFCGYNMGDYFAHWLEIGQATDAAKLPKLFWVNWFRRGEDGSFLWPGFGENSRVLKWVVERLDADGDDASVDTPIGRVPVADAIDVSGLDLDAATLAQLLDVDTESWRAELPQIEEHYRTLGERVPAKLGDQLDALEKRLAET
jgi:phosphoenolpyruvate carboxykinase (GTP)